MHREAPSWLPTHTHAVGEAQPGGISPSIKMTDQIRLFDPATTIGYLLDPPMPFNRAMDQH